MASIEDREKGFERKFAMDEEMRFRAMARRNKMLGLWAAERLGRYGADAEAYAREVVLADFEEAGDGDVVRKVQKDLEAAGKGASESEIRRVMDDLLAKAVQQLQQQG